MSYVDGFVIPIPKKKMKAYEKMAKAASKVWMEHGALDYKECVADDLEVKCGLSFKQLLKLKPGETVVFAWITYKSRKHRDQVNAKVMKDPRINEMMKEGEPMPFDDKRMSYGGFAAFVEV